MKRVNETEYYCIYCDKFNVPLVQLGKEVDWDEELEKYVISPEDANAVEICEECLRKALKLF